MDNQPTGAKPRETTVSATASRASTVTVADFSEALSTGVLRAIDARKIDLKKPKYFQNWVWAGWIIGDGPFGGQPDFPVEGDPTQG